MVQDGHRIGAKRAASSLELVPRRLMLAAMSGQVFRFEHRVPYALCTLGNHVYYSRYLDILEEARGEFFRHLGQPLLAWQEATPSFP